MPLKRAISVRHKKTTFVVPKWRKKASEEIDSSGSEQISLNEMCIDDGDIETVKKFLDLIANDTIQSLFQFDRCRLYFEVFDKV